MAISQSIAPPTLRVYQVQKTQTPVFATPPLGALIVGGSYEIINALDDEGNLNDNAKFCSYNQLPLFITTSAFPSPRHNIGEVTVLKNSVRIFHNFTGTLKELPTNPGSAHLLSYNLSTRAVIRSSSAANFTMVGKTIVLSIDNPVRLDTTKDVVVTFSGSDPLTPAQLATQINQKLGLDLASSVSLTGDSNPRLQILSPTFGAKSSVTIRGGGSGNTTLGFASTEQRVEGSGFRGQEDNFGSDTLSPWIEWFRGDYLAAGTSTTFPVGNQFGQIYEDDTYLNSKTSAVTFGPTQTIDIKVGDEMYADGVLVNSGEVMKIESTRFKIGTINTTLSTFDANGKLLTAVRDQTQVRLLTDPLPFAPRYTYFRAKYINVNSLATAAVLTGANSGSPAAPAFVQSLTAPTTPLNLTGLNLKVTVTDDDVEGPEQTFLFTGGPYADMNAVVTAIGSGITGVVATNSSGKLTLSTIKLGKAQAIKLSATSTANSALNFSTVSDTTDIGNDVEFNAGPAVLTSATIAFPITLTSGDVLSVGISTDSGSTYPTVKTHTSAGATYNTITSLVSALTADTGFIGSDLVVSNTSNKLNITSALTGSTTYLRIESGSTAATGSKINYTIGQTAEGYDGINGKSFKFKINDRPKIYFTTFNSNSLTDAIGLINEAVGTIVGRAGGTGLDKLELVSTLKGYASKIEVISDTSTLQAIRTLGFEPSNNITFGSGRPNPDAYLDNDGSINLSASFLRNPVTGYPFDPATTCLYIQYKGLRKDVSSIASNPGILSFFDVDTVDQLIGPITAENPLALGVYMALLNAPNTIVRALGIDEVSDTYPEGTPDAYTRALRFTESEDDYTLVPLSQEEAVHRLFATHVESLHDPEIGNSQKARRTRICPKTPTRALDTLISSGLSANTPVSTTNQINLDINPSSQLLSAGINPALPIPYSAQVFLKVNVNGTIRNYSVSAINSVNVTLRTTFTTGQNTDSFFLTTPLTDVIVNADWSLLIRGNALLVPGSTQPDYKKIAETINQFAQTYNDSTVNSRRISYDFPDKTKITLNGITLSIPGYYNSCMAAGSRSYNAPQQSLSNFTLKGAIGKTDSKLFTESELDIIAGGGVAIFKSDQEGFPLYMRHQLTVGTDSIESKEESIGVCIDIVEKVTRQKLSKYLGNRNIDAILMDELATIVDGVKRFLIDDIGCLRDFKIMGIRVNPNRPDGIDVEVSITPFYPLNEIRFYIYF